MFFDKKDVVRFFFIFCKIFAIINVFFKVKITKYTAELGEIIKHSKTLGEMKKTMQFLQLFK